MKRFVPIIMVFFVIAMASAAYPQNLKYGFGGGLTYILGPSSYTGEIDTTGANFGFKSNYHIGGKIKIGLQPLPLRLTGQIIYTSFSGSRNNVIISPTTAIDLETSTNIFTVAFGGEYLFSPEPVSPYATLEVQLNAQGQTVFKRVYPNSTREIDFDSKARWGLGLGAGVDFGVLDQLDLDAGFKLNLVNLFGKSSNESAFTTFSITLNILYHPRTSTGTTGK
ncbi:MAG: outer membrane protein [Ignavibacteriales bacterium]